MQAFSISQKSKIFDDFGAPKILKEFLSGCFRVGHKQRRKRVLNP
jgi:hypothetical protein